MKVTGVLALLFSMLALSACSALTRSGESWPGDEIKACAANSGSSCNLEEAQKLVAVTIKYCREMLSHYERSGRLSNTASLGIGIAGALAGAVFAPIAGGSAALAWSGLSGATNGIQTQINSSGIGQTDKQALAIRGAMADLSENIKKAQKTDDLAKAAFTALPRCAGGQ